MTIIKQVIELNWIYEYLKSRNILKQYLKAKHLIINWNFQSVDFKKRKPKTLKVYQFKINQKYRAFWFFDMKDESCFKIIEISNHQD